MRWFLLPYLALVALAACHDARRANPLDPALTPAVTDLEAVVSDSAGTVLLTWRPYEGQMPFDHYLVLRKVKGLEAVDTVGVVSARLVSPWAETTPTVSTASSPLTLRSTR